MKTSLKSNKNAVLKSSDECNNIMQSVLELAKKRGVTDANVAFGNSSGFALNVRMADIDTLEFNTDASIALTVYLNHAKGSASSTNFSLDALNSMVDAALGIAQVSAADPCFGLADKDLVNLNYPELDLYHPADISVDEAVVQLIECERLAISLDKRITNCDGVNFSTSNSLTGYADTNGMQAVVYSSAYTMALSLIAENKDGMQRDYDYTTTRMLGKLRGIDDLAHSAAAKTLARLSPKKIKTCATPVVFASRIAGGLFASLISAISGNNLYRNNSFLLNSQGKQIFPKNIQVYERPHLSQGLGSAAIDAEGIITRNNVFIQDGVLEKYVLSSYSARRLKLKTTANAGGVFNLTVDPTIDGGLSEILHKMGRGVLVTELMGSGVNILTGDYSRGLSGFWVENGEIQYPIEEVTLAGNLRDMFLNIEAVGSDWDLNNSFRVGSVLLGSMMIAGA
jgi:PmbA protein